MSTKIITVALLALAAVPQGTKTVPQIFQGTSSGVITITTGTLGTPTPEWVPDPSAGHYDCPEGWTHYLPSEPPPHTIVIRNAIYISPNLDKKKHVLLDRPAAGKCIQD